MNIDWDKLTVDTSRFEKMGMKILTAEDVEGSRPLDYSMKWTVRNEPPFEPNGVTVEKALKAMSKIRKKK